ncbi:MAG TPA: flagellar biosynthetic protein FliP [Planctomycetaceae bacterium]|nr:flagellar biosynthetic protein FliP [Planctomycetaceae bacterium]
MIHLSGLKKKERRSPTVLPWLLLGLFVGLTAAVAPGAESEGNRERGPVRNRPKVVERFVDQQPSRDPLPDETDDGVIPAHSVRPARQSRAEVEAAHVDESSQSAREGDSETPIDLGEWGNAWPIAPSLLAMMALSVVPSLLLMTTCFVRFSIVLGLVRQALGTQQMPPNSVLLSLALFLSCLVMEPVWRRAYAEGLKPYLQSAFGESRPDLETTTVATLRPLREFMSSQIELAGNSEAVWVLLESGTKDTRQGRTQDAELTYDDIPFPTLAASYVLSELKVGFVIGFQILLPFLMIDVIVGLLLSTLGLSSMSPTSVAFPFKLLLFVLVDGWTVIVGRLLSSVAG